MDLTWSLHLQPTDPGWVDMGLWTPLMDTGRVVSELGWSPRHRSDDAVAEFVGGMGDVAGLPGSPPLRPGR